MRVMYEKCKLVHADLSAYNMLWHNNMLYFIDVAQGVDTMHPHAMEFLLRDCHNVSEVKWSSLHNVSEPQYALLLLLLLLLFVSLCFGKMHVYKKCAVNDLALKTTIFLLCMQ